MMSIRKLFAKARPDRSLRIIRLDETDSTNHYLRDYRPGEGEDMTVVVADYQTAGRGQGTNTWESERGQNLLFSVLVHPVMVPVASQYLLSMVGSVALQSVLSTYADGFTVKWPNDIYWHDLKVSGTLIETTLGGGHIKDCIYGVGVNVNQTRFLGSAPNPVSLSQIVGHEIDREQLLQQFVKMFRRCYALLSEGAYGDVSALYHDALYRRHGFWPYRDSHGSFEAAIVEVEDNGHLILRDRADIVREYAFKEVAFTLGSTEPSKTNIK